MGWGYGWTIMGVHWKIRFSGGGQGVFQVCLDMVYRFWAHLILAPKLGKPGKIFFWK